MRGKTVVITGASDGIGRAAARALGKMGATLILVGRNAEKTKIAAFTVEGKTHTYIADLSVMSEVRRLAEEIRRDWPIIDVLINNAGVINLTRRETQEGLENTWATNHFQYFLLTHLLLDVLEAAPAGRIVNVASVSHKSGSMNFDDLMRETGYSPMGVYGDTKLANVLFTYALARRLREQSSSVTVNCVHPGVVSTHIGQGDKGLIGRGIGMGLKLVGMSAEKGAAPLVHLASSEEVEKQSGYYFDRFNQVSSAPQSYDEEVQERLWELSKKIAGLGD